MGAGGLSGAGGHATGPVELIKQFCQLPVEYAEGDSPEARLVQVLLDQLQGLALYSI